MLIIFLIISFLTISENAIIIPHSPIRAEISDIKLSGIGQFGLLRKPRPYVPAHYHTGVDIKRPNENYTDEPIFPIAPGKLISMRRDGPYANLIIEHEYDDKKFWSLYEHISGITVNLNDHVVPSQPIAHFMNKNLLDRYGWQFDHLHLEILKVKPIQLDPNEEHPDLMFKSYTLACYTEENLYKYYYNPIEFLHSFPDILEQL